MSVVDFDAALHAVYDPGLRSHKSLEQQADVVEWILKLVVQAGGGFPVYQVITEHDADRQQLDRGFGLALKVFNPAQRDGTEPSYPQV